MPRAHIKQSFLEPESRVLNNQEDQSDKSKNMQEEIFSHLFLLTRGCWERKLEISAKDDKISTFSHFALKAMFIHVDFYALNRKCPLAGLPAASVIEKVWSRIKVGCCNGLINKLRWSSGDERRWLEDIAKLFYSPCTTTNEPRKKAVLWTRSSCGFSWRLKVEEVEEKEFMFALLS